MAEWSCINALHRQQVVNLHDWNFLVWIILVDISDVGIVAHDGVVGLYRGFVPNALKTLPNSRLAFSSYFKLIYTSIASHTDVYIRIQYGFYWFPWIFIYRASSGNSVNWFKHLFLLDFAVWVLEIGFGFLECKSMFEDLESWMTWFLCKG